jgi:hypothetical protein
MVWRVTPLVIHYCADVTEELNNYLNHFVIKNKELREILRHKNAVSNLG